MAPGTRIDIAGYSAAHPRASWASCATWPAQAEAVCLGAFGILQDGISCAPPPPEAIRGACCMGAGECQLLSQDECIAAGGTWNGSATCTEWTSCPRAEACGMHRAIHRGIWLPDAPSCTSPENPCPLRHVCCIGEHGYLLLERQCAMMGGVAHVEWDSCGPPNPCPGTPAVPETPGGGKQYR